MEEVQPALAEDEEVASDSQIQAHVPGCNSAPSSPQRSLEHSTLRQIQLQPSPQAQHPSQSQHRQTSSWYLDSADSDSESLSDVDTQSVIEAHMDLDVVGESE